MVEEYKEEYKKEIKCKYCGSVHIVKNGFQENRNQRYICRDCKKSFSIGDKRIRYDIILRKLTITLFF
jgi:transposase-like protein